MRASHRSPLLELANYHVLGRIFYYVPYFAPLPPGRVLSIFGFLMAFVETLNALGVALNSNPHGSSQGLGSILTLIALALQVCVILVFILLAALFQLRCSRAKIHSKSVKILLITLYASMTLIFVRCIYRLVEHVGNTSIELDHPETFQSLNPLLRYEWFFFVFESTFMLLNSALWNVWNPARYLPKSYNIYLSRDGKTEVEGDESVDERTILAKIGHAVTFGLFFSNVKMHRQFHELREM